MRRLPKDKLSVDVAVIKNDVKWMKEVLTEINNNVKTTKACVDNHDNRIQVLEDWRKFSNEEFNKNMLKWGAVIGVISIVISIIFKIL